VIVLALGLVPRTFADWEKTYDWTAIVGVSSVVASPSDPHRIYAFVGNTPWLIRSDDAGLTWQKTATVGPHSGVDSVAVDPIDSAVIYFSVSSSVEPGLNKSVDGGKSFVPLGESIFTSFGVHIAIDPHEPKTLYATYATRPVGCTATSCTEGGIVKSVDGGLSWFQTARVDSGNGPPVIDPNNTLIVYTAGYDLPMSRNTGGLYRTMDGGLTWPSMFPGLSYIGYLTTDIYSRVYAIGGVMFETPLLRSSNHGELWSRLRVDVSPPTAFREGAWPDLTAVLPDPRRPETIYLSSYTHGVLVSYDDGASWQPLGELPDHFVNTIAITPDGVIFAAAQSGIYRYVTPPFPSRRQRAVTKQ
jgi:hypothetical protein